MAKQLLSFLCPSYNHEKYVKSFIDSLLQQTNPNWELIIVDDCSTDNNVAEIEQFEDKRIKLFKNPFNMGINCSINHALEKSCGDFVVFCASDDMFANNFVETILNTFNQNPDTDVIYSNLQIMNCDGNIIKDEVWTQPKCDKSDILRHLFFNGNILLSPGMTFRRPVFETMCPLPIALSQYQDYKIHIHVALNLKFMIIDKPLVIYRKPCIKSGISARNRKTIKTEQLEENILMDSFLEITNITKLQEVFGGDLLKRFGNLDNKLIPYYLGMLALDAKTEHKKLWGYNQIAKFISDPKNYDLLNKKCNFCYRDFLNLADKFSPSVAEKKYIKYKKLFNLSVLFCFIIIFLIFIFMI